MHDPELIQLAREHGTPLYVYDLRRVRTRVAELREALAAARATLYFATMANDRLPVLRLLASLGLGACVNSIPHLQLALDAGFTADAIQSTSTGVTGDDMRLLQAKRIRTNLDSISQLAAWFESGGPDAGIRVNAASLGRSRSSDRIGIEAAELGAASDLANKFNRRLAGLHIYVGTNFQQPDEMLPTLAAFFDVAARLGSLSYVNIGGGIGVDYQHRGSGFDVGNFGASVAELANQLRTRLGRDVEVIVEPGRAMVAACGSFVTAVTDVKVLAGQRFAAVDSSIAVFPRPLHHPEDPHRIRPLSRPDGARLTAERCSKTTIVGRTTFSRDILGSATLSDDLRIGDLLVLDDAGAYAQSMASRFLGQPEPAAVFADG